MAKKFLTPIDLSQLELQNAKLQNLATAPGSPVTGQVYFNTTTNKAMVWNGSSWIPWEADTNTVTGVKGNSESSYRTGNVNITAANVGAAASSHAHGNITSGGDITATAPTIASGDQIIINDDSASKVTNGPTFDGSTTTKALTPKGTWETFSQFSGSYNDLTNKPTLGDAAAKGVVTSITGDSANLPTTTAVRSYVSTAIAGVDAMRFKGTIGTGGTVTTLPTTGVKVGDTYRVITAGTYAGQTCEVGDLIIATATTPTWTVAQTNIDGAVTATTTTTSGYIAKFTGNKVVANGPQLGSSTTTYLRNDGSWGTPAGTYSLPLAASGTRGGVKIGYTQSGKNYPVQLSDEKMYVNVPWENTTYSNATTSAAGLMSSTDKSSLDTLVNSYQTARINAGSTSVSVSNPVMFYTAYIANSSSSYEEAVIDCSSSASGDTVTTTFSIAAAIDKNINITYQIGG